MKLNDKPLHLKHGGHDNFNAKISSDVTVFVNIDIFFV